MDSAELDRLATLFRRFAAAECAELPLYHRLCMATADRPELLAMYADTAHPQRRANLLLAAVHDLLLAGADHRLARWYPTINGGVAPPDEDPFPAFVDFIGDHRAGIRELLATRTTQTNEVNRSCLWKVAVPYAVADVDAAARPIALVEVGASAGLSLNVDRYRYDYGDGVVRGELASPVRLRCAIRGGRPPLGAVAAIGARIGLDQDPVDIADGESRRWLQACIWPEQLDRHRRFLAAAAVTAAHPPRLVRGDAVDDLAAVVEMIPADDHVVIINSWTITYLPRPRRAEFVATLDEIGAGRDLTWLSAEHPGCLDLFRPPCPPTTDDWTLVGMRRYRGGPGHTGVVAAVHPHLAWMRWAGTAP